MKARDAVEAFESFEDDLDYDELTDSEKVKGVLKELDDKRVRDLWKTLDGFSGN